MKTCIFLDIDGTLLDHEIGIQESSRTAIAQAQANGHRVCLATGRPKTEMDEEILAIPFDGYIFLWRYGGKQRPCSFLSAVRKGYSERADSSAAKICNRI